jgi:hypothetical protein
MWSRERTEDFNLFSPSDDILFQFSGGGVINTESAGCNNESHFETRPVQTEAHRLSQIGNPATGVVINFGAPIVRRLEGMIRQWRGSLS